MKLACILLAFLVAACASGERLRQEDLERVAAGMTQEQVRGLIGAPARTESFARLAQLAWDYPFTDSWGYLAVYSVIFDADGRVVGKRHTRIEPNDH